MQIPMFTPRQRIVDRIAKSDEQAIEEARKRVEKALQDATELPIVLPTATLGPNKLVRGHIVTRLKAAHWKVEEPAADVPEDEAVYTLS